MLLCNVESTIGNWKFGIFIRTSCCWSNLKMIQTWIFCPDKIFGDIMSAAIALMLFPVSPRAMHKPSNAEQAIDDQLDKSDSCGFGRPPCNVAKFSSKSYSGWIRSFGSDLKLSGTWPWITSKSARKPFVHKFGLTFLASAINSNSPFKPAPTI